MAIFRREDPPTSRTAGRPASSSASVDSGRGAGGARGVTTVISARTRVVGQISGRGEVQIDGQVDGEIELEGQVTIGEGGRLVGQVVARSVRVAGTVEGNLRATERIELLASGSIEGDVLTPRLAIHEGGLCRGRVEMRRPQERSETTAASTVLPSAGDPDAGRLAAEAKVHPGR